MSKLYTADRFVTIGGTTAQYVTGTGSLVTFPAIPSGADYIQNQNASAQSANMWISGSAYVNGSVGIGTSTPYGILTIKQGASQLDVSTGSDSIILEALDRTTLSNPVDIRSYARNGNHTWSTGAYSERMRITNAGNVGIGTSAPATRFDVQLATNKHILFHNGNGEAEILGSTDNGSAYAPLFISASPLVLNVNNGSNVGIGTSSPSGKLHISGSGNTETIIDATTAGSSILTMLSSSGGSNLIAYGPTGPLRFGTVTGPNGAGLSDRMCILANGNVGIGTSSPGYKLSVVDTLASSGGNKTVSRFYGSLSVPVGSLSLISYDVSSGTTRAFGLQSMDTDDNVRSLLLNPNGGNIGIGTTTPTAKLDLYTNGDQTLRFSHPTSGTFPRTDRIVFGSPEIDGGSSAIYGVQTAATGAPGYLSFYTTSGGVSGERMRIITNGDVGIGTTAPLYKLDVVGNIRAYTSIIRRDTSAGSAFINYNESASGYWSVGMSASSYSYDVIDANYGINKLSITNGSTWGVGIGTTSPVAKLHVSGSTYIRNDNTTNQLTIDNDSVGTNASPQYSDILFGGYSTALRARIRGVDRASNTTIGGLILQSSTDGTTLVDRLFLNGNGESYFYNNSSEVMRIGSTGNVGIGTTNPTFTLDVTGSAGATARFRGVGQSTISLNDGTNDNYLVGISGAIRLVPSGSIALTALGNGNVGIGTGTPSAKLTVQSNVNTTGYAAPGANNGHVKFNPVNQGPGDIFMEIGATNSPVGGYWLQTFLQYSGTAGGNMLFQPNGGNVGIGTTSPTNRLHVLGGILNGAVATFSGQNNDRGLVISTFNSGNSDAGVLLNAQTSLGVLSFATVGSERMRITSAGSVLINNTASYYGYQSQVRGAFYSYSTADDRGIVVFPNQGTPNIQGLIPSSGNANNIALQGSGGNVGIGTTAPGRKLTVQGNDDGTMQLRLMGTASQTSYWEIGRESLSTGQFRFIASRNGTVITPMVIDDVSGNVGIGTTNPITKLTVVGSISAINSGVDGSFVDAFVGAYSTNNNEQNAIQTAVSSAASLSGIRFQASNGGGSAGRTTVVDFLRDRQLFYGNVGIGTTSPQTLLQLGEGSLSNTTTNQYLRVNAGGYNSLSYAHLDLFNFGNNFGNSLGWRLTSGTEGAGVSVGRYLSFNTVVTDGGGNPSTSTERMRITSSGNVGIGTSTPAEKLDVNGNITLGTAGGGNYIQTNGGPNGTAHYYSSGVGNGSWDSRPNANSPYITQWHTGLTFNASSYYGGIRFYNQAYPNLYSSTLVMSIVNDNVGIGTTSPSQLLHVTGNARITGAIYDSSNSAGTSGQVLSSTGTGTAWVTGGGGGGISGSGTTNYVPKFTSSTNIGNSNISDSGTLVTISTDALINGVTVGRGGSNDISNTAVGNKALQSQTLGGKSTAIGVEALTNSTSGHANVGVGFQALFNITTGEYNLGVGAGAGSGIITGDYNNIIGNNLVFDPSGNSFDGSYALSIGKNSLAYAGYPQIWSPDEFTCPDSVSTTILEIDPAIYSGVVLDYCLDDMANSLSRIGTFKMTYKSDGTSVVFLNDSEISSGGSTAGWVVKASFNSGTGFVYAFVQNTNGSNVTMHYTARLLLRSGV
jgi:hypothetical protein